MSNGSATGWPTMPLGAVLTDIQPGFASGNHNTTGEGVPHFRPMNVSSNGRIARAVLKYVDPAAGRPELRLCRGDVLFNNTNSPELVGKTALFDDDGAPAFSNHMTRLRSDPERLDPGYLALRLHQAWREGWFARHCNNHVSQASISRSVLRGFEIELPPLELQRAIYMLSRAVDDHRLSCSGHLVAARQVVERFRRAVLAAACSGRLTAEWRVERPDATGIEDALATARSRRSRRRTKEEAPKLRLPDLPDTYVVAPLGEAADVLEYGTSRRAATSPQSGVPVLRMSNIKNGRLHLGDLKYMSIDREIESLLLEEGDLLFNRTNSPELVGKSAVFVGNEPATFASYLIRVRFHPDVALPQYVNFWVNSAWGRLWARQVKTDGVSQSNINGTKLALMPLPLPPLVEQHEIVRRTSELLGMADDLLARVERASLSVERSAEAVLTKALYGGFSMRETESHVEQNEHGGVSV